MTPRPSSDKSGFMKIVDLSHTIAPGMPVYPGTEPPVFSDVCTITGEGFHEKRMSLFSHTGTHIDAPVHIIPGGRCLDRFAVDHFAGRACVLDFPASSGQSIEIKKLQTCEPLITKCEFVFLKTGWSRFWGSDAYFKGYPVLTLEAAEWLCSFPLKGVGMDTISADIPGTKAFPVHRALLSRDILLIENLTNLDAITDAFFLFFCLPMKIERADGSPVRAAAVVE